MFCASSVALCGYQEESSSCSPIQTAAWPITQIRWKIQSEIPLYAQNCQRGGGFRLLSLSQWWSPRSAELQTRKQEKPNVWFIIICKKVIHWQLFAICLTLLAYIVQFVMSSESMAPSSPKSAPDAPTEMLDLMKRADIRLPPSPERMYMMPILTVKRTAMSSYAWEIDGFFNIQKVVNAQVVNLVFRSFTFNFLCNCFLSW